MRNYKQGIAALLIGILLVGSFPVLSSAAPITAVTIDGTVVKSLIPIQEGGLWYFSLDELGKAFNGSLKLNDKTSLHYFKLSDDIIQFKANTTAIQWNGLPYTLKKPIVMLSKKFYLTESTLEDLFRISVEPGTKANTLALVTGGKSATLSDLSGSVEILKKGDALYNWKAAKSKVFLFEKDTIRTGKNSKAELQMNDGSRVMIGENATVVLDKLNYNASKKSYTSHVRLLDGEVWATVVKQTNGSEFAILKDDHKLIAYGTVAYAGPSNVSVLSGLIVDQFGSTSNSVPTGTGAIYGLNPNLMGANTANWSQQGAWAMNQLEELQINTVSSNLFAMQMASSLPPNDPTLAQLTPFITDTQSKLVWNQFEIRQTSPLTGSFPSEQSNLLFVNKVNEIQEIVNKGLTVSSTFKNEFLSNQQILLDQFDQNLKVASMNNLMPEASINELSNYSNAIETKLPATLTIDPNKLPVVPIPPNSKTPEIGIPTDIKLPEGMVIPPGFKSEFSSLLPMGSMLPNNFNFSTATTLPENLMLPPSSKLPDNYVLPKGTQIPPGMDIRNIVLPEGVNLPKGIVLAPGLQLPNGVELPAGFTLPTGVIPPKDLSTFTPPIGYMPSPTASIAPAGAISAATLINAMKREQINVPNPNIIKDQTAAGGVQMPSGFTPPEGFVPPIGWKPPQNFTATNNTVPQGWEIISKNYADTNPALTKSFQNAVDNVFIGNMKLPTGFELPMGVTPSDQFKPPTPGWQPPQDWQPPQGFTPPSDWKLPTNWQPEAGFAAPPGFGEVPGKFTNDGWIPPKEFSPPEWWTPPKDWTAGQPLPKGSAPWEQLGMPIPGGGMTLPEGFSPPQGIFDPSKPPTGGTGMPTMPGGPQPPGMPPGGTQPPGMPQMPPGGGTQPPGMPQMPPGGATQPPGMPQMPPGGATQPPGMPQMPPGGGMQPPEMPPMPGGGGTQPPEMPPMPGGGGMQPPEPPPMPGGGGAQPPEPPPMPGGGGAQPPEPPPMPGGGGAPPLPPG